MKGPLYLVGSQAFLRFWSVLGCPGEKLTVPVAAETLRNIGNRLPAQIILYEESLTENFSLAEQKYFQESVDPWWIPLPAAEGGGAQ